MCFVCANKSTHVYPPNKFTYPQSLPGALEWWLARAEVYHSMKAERFASAAAREQRYRNPGNDL